MPGTDSEGNPNRAPFTSYYFETAVPVLKHLPLLKAVVSGRLSLTGVFPLTPNEEASLTEAWERVRFETRIGILSRARLLGPAAALPEVSRLVDSFDARQGHDGLVRLGLAALTGANGWSAAHEFNPDARDEPIKA